MHIHGVPPAFKETSEEIYVATANLLQAYARHNTQLLAGLHLHAARQESQS